MSTFIDTLLVLTVFTNLALLGGSRLYACIYRVSAQGALLGLLAIGLHDFEAGHGLVLTLVAMAIKTFLFPWLLLRSVREVNAKREVEGFVSHAASLLLGLLLFGVALWLGGRLPADTPHPLVLPVGFFGLFCGIFLIVARRLALMQVIGYLALENGIFLIGIALVQNDSYLVELGILLDILLSVLLMGTTIFQMNRQLEHIEADRLSILHD